jgi:hypothetical protein
MMHGALMDRGVLSNLIIVEVCRLQNASEDYCHRHRDAPTDM